MTIEDGELEVVADTMRDGFRECREALGATRRDLGTGFDSLGGELGSLKEEARLLGDAVKRLGAILGIDTRPKRPADILDGRDRFEK